MMIDEDWRLGALCHKRNNVFWYPPMEADAPEQYYSIAREVCRCCSLWKECLDDGVDEKWGMWGGLTPKERQPMKDGKQSLLKPHGSWLRYRQGCDCELCSTAHKDSTENVNVNMSVIPYMNETVIDISTVRYGLLE